MSNAFLNALQARAATIQQSREQEDTIKKCIKEAADLASPEKTVADVAAELEAKWFPKPENENPVQLGSILSADPEEITVSVELVLDRNRIDLRFSRAPEIETLQALKDRGWHFAPTEKRWYHKDTYDNRLFCEMRFGAIFDEPEAVEEEPAPVVEAPPSPEFQAYKRKVNALLEYTQMDAADLMLAAIDAMYREVFGKPN